MALNMGKILMAYRPLYLRGLLMDGQYRLPVDPPPPPSSPHGKKVKVSREVVATRTPVAPRGLQGARA